MLSWLFLDLLLNCLFATLKLVAQVWEQLVITHAVGSLVFLIWLDPMLTLTLTCQASPSATQLDKWKKSTRGTHLTLVLTHQWITIDSQLMLSWFQQLCWQLGLFWEPEFGTLMFGTGLSLHLCSSLFSHGLSIFWLMLLKDSKLLSLLREN